MEILGQCCHLKKTEFLFGVNDKIRRPLFVSLFRGKFLTDLCESKVREREGTFVCVSCNFRQQLQRAAGPHSLQTWPPLNCGQRLAASCCDIAVSPPGQDCNQASPLNRTLDFSSATFRLALNAASMTSLVGSPFFLAQNDSQSNYLVLTFFLILGDPIAF